ncbi:MAG: molecular chaperone HtpG [Chloroflexi bacterium]|nr:molecular chaperone HtpG [Chloroflexota bacterium]
MMTEYTFQAEIRQLLHTLVHSLYKDREIFLRELISNSSDALNRIQYEMLTNRDVRDLDAPLAIRIRPDAEAGTLTIEDTGVGMTREELIENLGTISQSGVKSFLEQANGQNVVTDIIGQFGVGFYSIFMVADRVEVHSLSYHPAAEAVMWISEGEETFEVQASDRSHRGTAVVLYLKEDAHEFLETHRLQNIIKAHSNYVAFPIYVGEDENPANAQQALWRRSSSEIEDSEYIDFYKSLTLDFNEPLFHIHSTADVPVQYYALLFIPPSREPAIFSPRREPGLQLYARKVLIQDYCTDLLPEYLNFIQGAVDSEDLPLNVSRETVQANRVMANMRKAITGRVLRSLKELSQNTPEKYVAFWEEFGPYIKQGMITDFDNRERLTTLLRFYTTKSEDELTSLDDYVQRMQEVNGQENIYYVLGDSQSVVSRSPHLEPFRARGIEVLYLTQTVDSFLINSLFEYNGHKLQNVDDEKLDLSEIGELQDDAQTVEEADVAVEEADLETLRERFTNTLGERVQSVRISKVLTGSTSPARLVSPEGTIDRHTQRVYQMMDREYEVPKKILEINPQHRLISNLVGLLAENAPAELLDLSIEQIYENALLLDGLHPNPAEMVARIQSLMEAATKK